MLTQINELVGIPFKDGGRDRNGLDCWGMVILAYKILHNKEIPDFKICAMQHDLVHKKILEQQTDNDWEELQGPEKGCIVAFRLHPIFVSHIGICIDEKTFLHCSERIGGVCIEKLNHSFYNKRIEGFYKWTK